MLVGNDQPGMLLTLLGLTYLNDQPDEPATKSLGRSTQCQRQVLTAAKLRSHRSCSRRFVGCDQHLFGCAPSGGPSCSEDARLWSLAPKKGNGRMAQIVWSPTAILDVPKTEKRMSLKKCLWRGEWLKNNWGASHGPLSSCKKSSNSSKWYSRSTLQECVDAFVPETVSDDEQPKLWQYPSVWLLVICLLHIFWGVSTPYCCCINTHYC